VTSTPEAQSFNSAFKAAYGRMPANGQYGANAYDAVFMAAVGVQAAGGGASGPQIGERILSLKESSASETVVVGPGRWAETLEAIKVGRPLDYKGASGPCEFDENGDTVTPYDVWAVQGSQLVVVDHEVLP
jgi:ABC-type branched-subunit amino acid transport system substrate-binding protein